MKKLIFSVAIIFMAQMATAQTTEFRVNSDDKPIMFRFDQVSADIVGYDGKEVIIKAVPETDNDTTRGLKQLPLYGRKADDYLINPKTDQLNNVLRIRVPQGNFKHLLIKVPETAVVQVDMLAFLNTNKLTVRHIDGIYIGAIVSDIEVSDVSFFEITSGGANPGRRSSDKIVLSDIRWSDKPILYNGQSHARPYHASGGSASITLTVPDSLKSDIFFSSRNGRVFSDLKATAPDATADKEVIDNDFPTTDNNIQHIAQNGGGIKISVGNNYGNIYLKKQSK